MEREPRPPKKTIELWIGPIRVSGKKTVFEFLEYAFKGTAAGVALGAFLFAGAVMVYALVGLAARFGLHLCG